MIIYLHNCIIFNQSPLRLGRFVLECDAFRVMADAFASAFFIALELFIFVVESMMMGSAIGINITTSVVYFFLI